MFTKYPAGPTSGAGRWLVAALVALGLLVAPAVAGADATYSHTQTIPVPPASSYAGGGGGDGWAVAMTPAAAYNVFHHATQLQVSCHRQSDASACWPGISKTIQDAGAHNFAISGQPSLWLDQSTGHLFVFARRTFDGTGGVVCIDTTQPAADPNPFCGFIALTAVGDSAGDAGISSAALVGTRWFAFNYVSGVGATGGRNALLCFDTATSAACAGQPFTVAFGGGAMNAGGASFRVPSVASIGTKVIVPASAGGGEVLACFDAASSGACAGSWPAAAPAGFGANYGAPFPTLSAGGAATGLCLPSPGIPCYGLTGASVPTPAGLAGAVTPGTPWNGPAVTIGPRIYVPNGNGDKVQCFDFGAGATCANFPKSTPGANYLYTVNPDPQRASCLWVNADNGPSQIQNFDAYTGGPCGQGPIRVLASSIVIPTKLCEPASYTSLTVVDPTRASYTSGSVAFQDGSGNPIPGIADRAVDANGAVSLTGLNLNTATGLPQFLITLVGASGAPSAVVVKLVWTGVNDPSCVRPGTTVVDNTRPTRLTANPILARISVLPPTIFLAPTAKLEALNPTQPLGGKLVKFTAAGTTVCTATTAANGTAGCSGALPLVQGTLAQGYTATFAGDAQYLGSSGQAGLLG